MRSVAGNWSYYVQMDSVSVVDGKEIHTTIERIVPLAGSGTARTSSSSAETEPEDATDG